MDLSLKDILQKLENKKDRVVPDISFHAAILILLMDSGNGELSLVFQKRSYHIRSGGEISFCGGKVDPEDLTPKHAVIREVYEEMGIEAHSLENLLQIDRLHYHNLSLLDVFIGFTPIKSLDEIAFNLNEVQSIFSLPLKYFMENKPQLSFLKTRFIARDDEGVYFPSIDSIDSTKKGKNFWEDKTPIYSYETPYGVIWGLTAYILYSFTNRLKD